MENNSFFKKLPFLNFVLAILIVLLHSSCNYLLIPSEKNYIFYYYLYKIIGTVADVATPTFFFISGFLFYRNFKLKQYTYKVKSRVSSLVWPFLFWSVLFFLIFLVLQKLPLGVSINQDTIEIRTSYIIKSVISNKYNAPLWYLRTLFIYALISPLIYILLRYLGQKSFIVIFLFIFLNLAFRFDYTSIFFWMPIYFSGAYASVYLKDWFLDDFIFKYRKKYILAMIPMSVFVLLLFICALNDDSQRGVAYYLYRMLSPYVLLTFTLLCDDWFGNKAIFQSSFVIFCSHSFIVLFIRKILSYVLSDSNNKILICYLLTVILTVGLIFAVYLLMRKYMKQLLYVINGFR